MSYYNSTALFYYGYIKEYCLLIENDNNLEINS